jgi:hypothetical protein
LARQVAISFENDIVKVVYASSDNEKLFIEKTLILRNEEFDGFLKREKTRHFTVAFDFKSFHEDILLIPPVKEQYIKSIIASEIKKKFPELRNPSFLYTVLGEKLHEGRLMKEVFIFAVSNEDLFSVINRFDKHNKKIKYLYPGTFALAHLVNLSINLKNELALCIAGTGGNTALFFIKDKNFIPFRLTQFSEKGIHNTDIQNINMTIAYCRQTLKLNPTLIALVGEACYRYHSDIDLALPILCIMHPSNIIAAEKNIIEEFIMPISAIFRVKDMEAGNILPQDYRKFYVRKTAIGYLTALLLLLSLLGLGYTGMKISEILLLKGKIESLRTEIKSMEPAFSNYGAKYEKLQSLFPAINIIKSAGSAHDFQRLLIIMEQFRIKNVNIHSIQINNEKGVSLFFNIKGVIISEGFADMHNNYQALLSVIKKNKEIELLSDKIDLKDKGFHIEARFKGN